MEQFELENELKELTYNNAATLLGVDYRIIYDHIKRGMPCDKKNKKVNLKDVINFHIEYLINKKQEKELKTLNKSTEDKYKKEIRTIKKNITALNNTIINKDKVIEKLNDKFKEQENDYIIQINELKEKLKEEDEVKLSPLTKLEMVKKNAEIEKINTTILQNKLKLIEKMELLCNKEKLETQFYEILNTLKESFLSTAHHSSYRLEDKKQQYIKEYLLREYRGIFDKIKEMEIDTSINDDEEPMDVDTILNKIKEELDEFN